MLGIPVEEFLTDPDELLEISAGEEDVAEQPQTHGFEVEGASLSSAEPPVVSTSP